MRKKTYWRRIEHSQASNGQLTLNKIYEFTPLSYRTWHCLDDRGNRWTNNIDQLKGQDMARILWEEATKDEYLRQPVPPSLQKSKDVIAGYAKRRIEASPDDHIKTGKIYRVYQNDSGTPYIRTDIGREWKLGVNWDRENPYWESISKKAYLDQNHDYSTLVELTGELTSKCAFASMNEKPQPTKEVKPMKISTEVQIDGTNVSSMSDDTLIGHINAEKKAMAYLVGYDIKSTNIAKRIAAHEANIEELIKLLDARV